MIRFLQALLTIGLGLSLLLAGGTRAEPARILIGLDAEFSHRTSTSDDAIRAGMLAAMEEINRRGGVLGGRLLALETRDNRGVPARGADNLRDLAGNPDVVAVLTGKFSPVVIEQLPIAHELKIPLLDPWAAANDITEHAHAPNFVFRLSLRDDWAIGHLLGAAQRRRLQRIGMIIPNGAWGRSSLAAATAYVARRTTMQLVEIHWFNWANPDFGGALQRMQSAGVQGLVLVGNEGEAAALAKEMVALPPAQRLPVFAHWGIAGGDFVALAGEAATQIDLQTVQTFTFHDPPTEQRRAVLTILRDRLGIAAPEHMLSQSGFAHAYDLVHILARAIDRAGNTDRRKVRDALEQVRNVPGLVRHYARPFAPDRREALGPEHLFVARYRADGALVRSR